MGLCQKRPNKLRMKMGRKLAVFRKVTQYLKHKTEWNNPPEVGGEGADLSNVGNEQSLPWKEHSLYINTGLLFFFY